MSGKQGFEFKITTTSLKIRKVKLCEWYFIVNLNYNLIISDYTIEHLIRFYFLSDQRQHLALKFNEKVGMTLQKC